MRQYLMMDERAMIDFHDAEVLESCSGEQDAWEAVKDWSEMNGVLFFIPEDAGQEPRMVGWAPDLIERGVADSMRACQV